MAKLRMAHASTHGARKPPGPMYCPQMKLGSCHKNKIVLEKEKFSKMHRFLRKNWQPPLKSKIYFEKNHGL